MRKFRIEVDSRGRFMVRNRHGVVVGIDYSSVAAAMADLCYWLTRPA